MSAVKALGLKMLVKEAEADEAAALLSFELLGKEAVGVGEHSTDDFRGDLRKALDALVDARDRLACLKENFGVEP